MPVKKRDAFAPDAGYATKLATHVSDTNKLYDDMTGKIRDDLKHIIDRVVPATQKLIDTIYENGDVIIHLYQDPRSRNMLWEKCKVKKTVGNWVDNSNPPLPLPHYLLIANSEGAHPSEFHYIYAHTNIKDFASTSRPTTWEDKTPCIANCSNTSETLVAVAKCAIATGEILRNGKRIMPGIMDDIRKFDIANMERLDKNIGNVNVAKMMLENAGLIKPEKTSTVKS